MRQKVIRRALRALLPPQLGQNFPWLWWSVTTGNVGDGVLLAAGPLLVASITREPLAIAMAIFAQRLPWLLFGFVAGAVIDRLDKRALVMNVDLFRALLLGLLAAAIATDVVNLPIVYVSMFLLGTAETFADNASSTMVALTVPTESIGKANARVLGSFMVSNQLAGPPLGAFLFALGIAIPFGFTGATFLIAVLLFAKIRLPSRAPRETVGSSLRREIADGLQWLWRDAPVRTLAIMITTFNITFGAAFSIWVLYAFERLGLDDFGFGLLLSASAVGGVVGSAAFGRLEERVGYARLLRIGLVLETFTHLGLVLTRSALVAGTIMFAFGVHAVIWGTTATTIRHRAVPERLLGRVTSVYNLGSIGALSIGSLIGGIVAQEWGVLAPFWFAFVGSAVLTVLIWSSIANLALAAQRKAVAPQDIT